MDPVNIEDAKLVIKEELVSEAIDHFRHNNSSYISGSDELEMNEVFKGVINLVEDSEFKNDYRIKLLKHLYYTKTAMSLD